MEEAGNYRSKDLGRRPFFMQIVWGELKRLANLRKHSLDFADLSFDFFVGARLAEAKGGRIQAIGTLHDRTVVVIVSRLGNEAFAIIGLRPASARERKVR